MKMWMSVVPCRGRERIRTRRVRPRQGERNMSEKQAMEKIKRKIIIMIIISGVGVG